MLHSNDFLHSEARVTLLADLGNPTTSDFLATHGLVLAVVGDEDDVPASYWGAPEAGIIGNLVYARGDTPIHSILHTACHWICMDEARRAALHTDADGDDEEEAAVCYLQCLIAGDLAGYSRARAFVDMDSWGYSFRLGSTQRWFEDDAEDAQDWLRRRGLIARSIPMT